MELISIIVPVYKVEKYLCECVDSILSQTYENFELILVDDGSPDNSGKICDEYAEKDKRIKVIHKENGGLPSARNAGLNVASGEYVAFVDSDDAIENNYLEELYKTIVEEKSDISFCKIARYNGIDTFDFKEKLPDHSIDVNYKNEEFSNFAKRFFTQKNNFFGSVCRSLFPKKVYTNVRFDEGIKKGAEDLVFTLNSLKHAEKLSFVDKELYKYRVNLSSVSYTYKKDFLASQINFKRDIENVVKELRLVGFEKILDLYFCLICYYIFSNELKFRKSIPDSKTRLKEIRKSEFYPYFKLKNVLKLGNGTAKQKLKHLIIWVLAKTRIWG